MVLLQEISEICESRPLSLMQSQSIYKSATSRACSRFWWRLRLQACRKNTLGIPLTNRPRITYWTLAGATRDTRAPLAFLYLARVNFSTRAKQIPPFLEHFPKNTLLSLHLCVCWGERGEGRDNIAFDLADEGASARKTILHIDLCRKQQVASINKKPSLARNEEGDIFWIEWKAGRIQPLGAAPLYGSSNSVMRIKSPRGTRPLSFYLCIIKLKLILFRSADEIRAPREMLDRRRSRNNWLLAFSVARDLWSFAA